MPNLEVVCVYCSKPLSVIDKYFFDGRKLHLLWQTGVPRAVCEPCLRVVARHERNIFFERQVAPSDLEKEWGIPLGDLPVRCQHCYIFLVPEEKLNHISRSEPYVVVAGKPRGTCTVCKQQQ